MKRHPLAIMGAEELRYDVLPPWAWSRPHDTTDLSARRIAAMERLMRENERAFADDLSRLSRLITRHRMNACAYRAHLMRLKREGAAR